MDSPADKRGEFGNLIEKSLGDSTTLPLPSWASKLSTRIGGGRRRAIGETDGVELP